MEQLVVQFMNEISQKEKGLEGMLDTIEIAYT